MDTLHEKEMCQISHVATQDFDIWIITSHRIAWAYMRELRRGNDQHICTDTSSQYYVPSEQEVILGVSKQLLRLNNFYSSCLVRECYGLYLISANTYTEKFPSSTAQQLKMECLDN